MKELATALAKAQAMMKPALKDSTNPHFKSKYADLTSVWEACRDALTKNGLSVAQVTEFDGETTFIRTILLHASGETLEGRYPLRPVQNTPQGMGSAISYARRYALAAMVGVVADDDDGNAASNGHDDRPRHTPEPTPPPQQTMAGRKNEAAGKRTAEGYKADCIAALAKITTREALNAWIEAERDTLDKLSKASPAAHTAIMDKIDEVADRAAPARSAAE